MALVMYTPPASLRRYVECFWTFRCPMAGISQVKLMANGTSGILVQHTDRPSALCLSSEASPGGDIDLPKAFLYGKRRHPAHIVARGPLELTGAVFRPQALHGVFRIDAGEVCNRAVDANDLFASGLDQLLNTGEARERIAVLGRCLSASVGDERDDDPVVRESLRILRAELRTVRIPAVLKRVGVSERQFERRFRRAVGLSPHQYLRILRFQEAVELLRDRQFDRMLDLATELNYADQSHFIKDIKELSGYTPTALVETVRSSVDLPGALILAPRTGGHR